MLRGIPIPGVGAGSDIIESLVTVILASTLTVSHFAAQIVIGSVWPVSGHFRFFAV